MVTIPEPVRRQALAPFWEMPLPPRARIVERDGYAAFLHPFPFAQLVMPRVLLPDDVEAVVADSRGLVREHGAQLLAWWTGVDHLWLGERLAEIGLANEDTPGFEAVETVMALMEPPASRGFVDGVNVVDVTTFQEFAASERVRADAFERTPEMRAKMEAEMEDRYTDYTTPGNPVKTLIAMLDGRVVGSASALLGPAGVNLLGGAVLQEARSRGVYRALTLARWELAVARDTPALTIQAGKMSRPIAERLGFQFIADVPIYVDDLS